MKLVLSPARGGELFGFSHKNIMNHWTKLSIDFANQRNYLDELFRVYPTIPDSIRDIDEEKWKEVEKVFGGKDDVVLLRSLLKLKLFPIKDSYVAYLKRDKESILRNPKTVKRLCLCLRDMGLDKIWEKCSEPKETNRQIGPLFGNWLKKVNSVCLCLTDKNLHNLLMMRFS